MRLLAHCAFDPAKDKLWFVGDLVNRGPRSLDTLRFIRGLDSAAITVLGNHDLTLLMVWQGLRKKSKGDTFDEILAASDCDDLLHWLRRQPLLHQEGEHVMVHAGLLPQWSVNQAAALAKEAEAALSGENWRDFLANIWGNSPSNWHETLTGWPRLRVIINAMTRLRCCTETGEMDLKAKGDLADIANGYMPWFDVPNRGSSSAVLVIGHWSTLGLRMTDQLLALDTGCLWGGKLTAVRLEDRALFQVDCSEDEIRGAN